MEAMSTPLERSLTDPYIEKMGDSATVFLAGDVMTGRGVDQILPHPGDSRLRETYVKDAGAYVDLAERINGPIPRPVGFDWPWGDALAVLDEARPSARVINLETSITTSDDVAYGKAVHYRMAPGNVGCLTAARPDVCVLANNHVLDFGPPGLAETLDTLAGAGLATAGAGGDADAASRPAILTAPGGGRVIVVSCGTISSGIPMAWAATGDRPGVDLLPDLSTVTAERVVDRVRQVKRPGDLAIASIHWGANWGYEVPDAHIGFAHDLVDRGVDVVHGHSSHHPCPIEIYRGKLILYSCGDLINDYEGIGGYEAYRDDLRLLYLASLDRGTGELRHLRMVPVQARQMRLHHASGEDAEHLRSVLERTSRRFGSRIRLGNDSALHVPATG
jgi:poly-gamma-glutamate capsule biosynthesis protein CapA/YwtB (metallophosphatase superfamily)